jgi:uncharacterized protein YjbI with pentapeptide repeats
VRVWISKFLRSPAVLMVIGGVATIILLLVVVYLLWRTSGAKAVSDNAAVIGALVALGGVFTAQMVSIALDDRRTQEARDLEAQRAGEAALQNYFEAVGELLIEKPLYKASPDDRLSAVVRAQTLSVLEGLDPDRKQILLLFLYESGLLYKRKPVVSLGAANLREANLIEADLSEAALRGANLSDANLIETNLMEADLFKADLSKANLFKANLFKASLSGADLSGANLIEAILSGADLRGANLIEADLSDALLFNANLSDAFLFKANLRGASEWTEEQLTAARNLEGATMSDGQKYEDWLKSKGHGEEGKNSSP